MHLSSSELLDLAEGTSDESRLPHLRGCERCRRRVEELRATMSAAADVDVPEPSPLFWQHLSTRVHDAVSADGAPFEGNVWRWARGWRGWSMSVAAAAALLLATAIATRVSAPAPQSVAATRSESLPAIDPLPDDPALNMVADLAATMNFDDASEIEVSMHAGGVDEAVGGLSAGERQELRRLLSEALRQPGG